MRGSIKRLVEIIFTIILSFSAYAETPPPVNVTGQLTNGAGEGGALPAQTAKNILLIVDRSSSQNDKYYLLDEQSRTAETYATKSFLEKELISQINDELPQSELVTGLRTFGYGACLNWKQTEQLQAMQPHSKSSFQMAAQKLTCASGGTPANVALQSAQSDLRATNDNKAILFLSDGNFTVETATQAVHQLKQEYGKELCIYPIWNGNSDDLDGYQNMKKITASSCCGFTEKASNLLNGGIAQYLQRVVYDFYTPVDSDCDGVVNDDDLCPNTPLTAKIDEAGCWYIKPIYFDTDKSEIVPEHYATLEELFGILKNNSNLLVLVKGNTDTVASYKYNMALSAKRAKAVQQYLIKRGLSANQITTEAEGFLIPVASNKTAEGRRKNRRAEFYVVKK